MSGLKSPVSASPLGGAADPTPGSQHPSHQDARDAEYSRVMAEGARKDLQIRTLKRLLWREVARHRRAHRYGNAKDIETALQMLD